MVSWEGSKDHGVYTKLGVHHILPEGVAREDLSSIMVQESILIALDQMKQCSDAPEDEGCQDDLTYIWRGEGRFPKESVTLATQFSVNRLERFERSIPLWPGAISVAIYLTQPEDAMILRRYLEDPVKGKLYRAFHLTIVQPRYESGPRPKHLSYPINHLRNLAVQAVTTTHHLLIDGDFSPDPGMYSFLHSQGMGKGRGPTLDPSFLDPTERNTAWVIPCVAIPLSYTGAPPGNVTHLRELFRGGNAYITDPRAGHGPTGTRLFLSPLLTMGSMRGTYEVCYESQWEPYYILPRDTGPLWDARFRDQGGDKQEHALVLNALGWRFRVLHDSFLYHIDHPQWRWPGGKDPNLEGHDQDEEKREVEGEGKEEWSYFNGFSQEIRRVFGETVKWPRACSQPLYVSSQVSVEGIGLL
ncbi:glycosyl-transferase for dystroglycan-domain-containing protein [Piptocephalis cylindrospora]|uniref:Glycosyl-transferase for dystroglycan-domain-containing protein n=1 Tax=Piptocephalis cylindrospora TaxID=1907219 RepID=A0A4P9XYI2_9FUNG|nr:glycosyl-transferase for dystroglycan-domain-containing protein [Piptocephalis cylindrospora]|eukprot:RKP11485.1 glycosyl-transferase for dystroglycan-domain-containing protein [Piptocephalis cylindrospora]